MNETGTFVLNLPIFGSKLQMRLCKHKKIVNKVLFIYLHTDNKYTGNKIKINEHKSTAYFVKKFLPADQRKKKSTRNVHIH